MKVYESAKSPTQLIDHVSVSVLCTNSLLLHGEAYYKLVGISVVYIDMEQSLVIKAGLARMLKGGVIMVTVEFMRFIKTPDQIHFVI